MGKMRKWVDQWGVSHEKQTRSVFPSISNVMNEIIEEFEAINEKMFSSPSRRKNVENLFSFEHPLGTGNSN